MASQKLTPKQAAFVREYLIDRNATQAAIRAGFSAKTAAQKAYQLLHNCELVTRAIAKAEGRLAEAAGIDAVMVLEKLAAIAFADMGRFAEWGGEVRVKDEKGKFKPKPKPGKVYDSRKVDTRAVQRIKISPDGSVDIRLGDPNRALQKLGEYFGLFDPDARGKAGDGAVAPLQNLADAIRGADVPDMSEDPDSLPDEDDEP